MKRVTAILLCALVHYSYAFLGNSTPVTPFNPYAYSILPVELIQPPIARTGAVLGQSKDGFVLVGGDVAYGTDHTVWEFDTLQYKWTQKKSSFDVAGACSTQDGDFLYIYGGWKKADNHLYRYQISTDDLKQLNVTGNVHPATYGVSCGLRNQTLYLFGGKGGGNKIPITKCDLKKETELKWEPVDGKGDSVPPSTVGASGLIFGDEFVLWGGSSDGNVWKFDLVSSTWTSVQSTSTPKPDPRRFHSAAVDTLALKPSFVFFGGSSVNGFELYNDSWVYNVLNDTWTQLDPVGLKGFPAPREMAASIYILGRFFIYAGAVTSNDTVNDLWQLVLTEDCLARSHCDDCVLVAGCGWCAANQPGYQCIPGVQNISYVKRDCAKDFSVDLDICPPEGFPGWIIALIIVATILLIGVVWFFVMRCQKKSGGYEQIN